MAEIFPFKGLLFNIDKVKNISEVVTPPYDVITEKQIEYFYNLNEFNIIKLILPEGGDKDKYKNADKVLKAWILSHVLIRDKVPCIYVIKEEFLFKGIKKERKSFVSLVKLEDFKDGAILPHEGTLSHPKKDRLELIKACRANLCPIFGLYVDPVNKINKILEKSISSLQPDLKFSVDEPVFKKINSDSETKVLHKMWRVTDEKFINKIILEIKDKKIFIADGHHRYEAALSLKKTYGFVMMQLFNLEDNGIIILPTHRAVRNISSVDAYKLEKNIEENFLIRKASKETIFNELEKSGKEKKVFGVYNKKDKFRLLTALNFKNELDVNIIHNKLLNCLNISYTIDINEAISGVEKGKYDYVFFLNPTKIKEVENIANCGERMPGKSTYFFPKLITGLVINKWNS